MGLDSYVGIGKPEDTKTIEAIENPMQAVDHIFELWEQYVHHTIPKKGIEAPLERLLEEAEKMLEHHALPAAITTTHSLKKPYQEFTGLFYTALLNCGVRKVIVTKDINNIGYRLKKGTFEISADNSGNIGSLAEGGCIINHAKATEVGWQTVGATFINYGEISHILGAYARGGVFVNVGKSADMGYGASGGIFVNRGTVSYFLALFASGGRYINYSTVGSFAYNIHDGICLNYGDVENFAFRAKSGFYGNYGTAQNFARDALGGIFANLGTVHSFGTWANGGILINNGRIVGEFGYGARDGLFIATKEPEPRFVLPQKHARAFIKEDAQLLELIALRNSAGLQKYCEENYGSEKSKSIQIKT